MNTGYPGGDNTASPISHTGNCAVPPVSDSAAVPQRKRDPKVVQAIGQRIRKTRMARGMSQTDLAESAGVKNHTMWRYEQGKTMPSAVPLEKIADALGVPQRFLLRGGPTPPNLSFDDEPKPRRPAYDPPIAQEQQIALLDELDASPALRACWGIHRQGIGAYQRITRVYMSRFIEIAQQELDDRVAPDLAAQRAGEYAFNAAVEAHSSSRKPPSKRN